MPSNIVSLIVGVKHTVIGNWRQAKGEIKIKERKEKKRKITCYPCDVPWHDYPTGHKKQQSWAIYCTLSLLF